MDKKEKKSISVLIADGSSATEYINFLKLRFDVKVLKTYDRTKSWKEPVDLIVFTGGDMNDLPPSLYEENTGKFTKISENDYSKEMEVYRNFKHVPKVGIGKGAHLLTILSGGQMIQHCEGHNEVKHDINIYSLGSYHIESNHHQLMDPFNLPKNSYSVIGWSRFFLSNTYLDGDDEEVELPRGFLETEIIKYNKTNSLCIQAHVEISQHNDFKDTCLYLIEKLLDNNSNFFKENSIPSYQQINFEQEQLESIGGSGIQFIPQQLRHLGKAVPAAKPAGESYEQYMKRARGVQIPSLNGLYGGSSTTSYDESFNNIINVINKKTK